MMILKENALRLIDNMKKLSYLLLFIFLVSCTSNTIFEKPKDLIPKDTMQLLIEDMMIASSAKFVRNKNDETKINYISFIYDKYKIDSLRFQRSNFYYTSKIEVYEKMVEAVKKNLEERKEFYVNVSKKNDSIERDSLKNASLEEVDTLDIPEEALETFKKIKEKATAKKKN